MKIYWTKEELENAANEAKNYFEVKGLDIKVLPFHYEPQNLNWAKKELDSKVDEYRTYLESIKDRCWVTFDEGDFSQDWIEKEIHDKFPVFEIAECYGIFENFYSDFHGSSNFNGSDVAYQFFLDDTDEDTISKCANYLEATSKYIWNFSDKNELVSEMEDHYIGYYDSYEELFDEQYYEDDVLGSHASIIRNHIGWGDDDFYKEIIEDEEGYELYESNGYYYHD